MQAQKVYVKPLADNAVRIRYSKTERDKPMLYYGKVKAETSFTSYPADAVD